MNALFQSIDQRQRQLATAMKSASGFSIPSLARNHAYILSKDGNGVLGFNDANAVMQGEPDDKKMRAVFVVSTEDMDREGDVVLADSPIQHLDNYKRAGGPIFFGHQSFPIPIGSCTAPDGTFEFWCKDGRIESAVWFAQAGIDPRLQPTGTQMFGLVQSKLMRSASLGFHPIRGERLKSGPKGDLSDHPGFLFRIIDVLEWSVVGTPMHQRSELISVGLSKGLLFGDPICPVLRKALVPLAVPMTGAVRSGYFSGSNRAGCGGKLPVTKAGQSQSPLPVSAAVPADDFTPRESRLLRQVVRGFGKLAAVLVPENEKKKLNKGSYFSECDRDDAGHCKPGGQGRSEASETTGIDAMIDQHWETNGIKVSPEFKKDVMPKVEAGFVKLNAKLEIDQQWLRDSIEMGETPEEVWKSLEDNSDNAFSVFTNAEALRRTLIYDVGETEFSKIDPDGQDDTDFEDAIGEWTRLKIQETIKARKQEIMNHLEEHYATNQGKNLNSKEKASYFADCDRDEGGHCKPSGQGEDGGGDDDEDNEDDEGETDEERNQREAEEAQEAKDQAEIDAEVDAEEKAAQKDWDEEKEEALKNIDHAGAKKVLDFIAKIGHQIGENHLLGALEFAGFADPETLVDQMFHAEMLVMSTSKGKTWYSLPEPATKAKSVTATKASYFAKEQHHKPAGEGGGQFTSGGGSASSTPASSNTSAETGTVLDEGTELNIQTPDEISTNLGKIAGAAEHLHHYLHDKAAAGFGKLPTPVQGAVKAVLSVAFAGWTASQNIAERISIEKGSTPEQAAATRSALAAWDIVAFKPMAIATAPLGGAVAAATWIVPPITGIYLAHAAVRHPIATFRAAKGIISDILASTRAAVDSHTVHLSATNYFQKDADPLEEDQPTAEQTALVDALERQGYDDWYAAILHAALEETKDVNAAVDAADQAFAANPADTSTPEEDDADALFAPEDDAEEKALLLQIGKQLQVLKGVFSEDDHPRGQPGNAGQFGSGGGGDKPADAKPADKPANKPAENPADKPATYNADKPNFMGDKDNPATFLVLPGKGKDGEPLKVWNQETRYPQEVARVGESSALNSVEPVQRQFTSLASDIMDGEDADEAAQAGLAASEKWATDFTNRLETRQGYAVNSLKDVWGEDADAESLAAIEAAK
jgi:hypothetical protein